MYCTHCGSQVSAADVLCTACGKPQPAQAGGAAVQQRIDHPYYGVGGWLVLFLIGLMLSPFLYARNVLLRFHHNMDLFAQTAHPYSLYASYAVETLAGFVLYGYGVFAGFQLWLIRPKAVEHAKRFLVYLLCYRIADYVMGLNWITLMGPEHSLATALSNFLAGKSAQAVLRAALYVASGTRTFHVLNASALRTRNR